MKSKVVLASGSPQRLALLRQIGIEPIVVPANIDESPKEGESAFELVSRLAASKAAKVAATNPNDVVIAADSVVLCRDQIMGKPADEQDAQNMLKTLSNTTHRVLTGHCVIHSGIAVVHVEETKVLFRQLKSSEIKAYLASGEYVDKAGACSIQGFGSVFVSSINGSYSNVVGLCLGWISETLTAAGIDYSAGWVTE